VTQAYSANDSAIPSQAEVIGAVNTFSSMQRFEYLSLGQAPRDLYHKLLRATRNLKRIYLEYGYSCMGYEISGGLGAKMAFPEREIYVILGDGGYLMMPSEIITSLQERYKITIILIDNTGFATIGGLSKSIGSEGWGTKYSYRTMKREN
jgi:3D-(3,5/4)-trihydroxycyclohexane-1,2-dione acylhydrolase (decyclizing)